jgi:hypothetical protein
MKTKSIVSILFFTLLFLGKITAFATNEPTVRTIIVSGKVSDVNSNELLGGVNIKLSNGERIIYSDLNGNFFINLKLKEGETFTIEFSQVGYKTKTISSTDLSSSLGQFDVNLDEE